MTTPIAAELGRVALPAQRTPFDDVRLALLDTIVAAKDEANGGAGVWLEAFAAAARSLRLRVVADADAALRAAARHSHYPSRRLRGLLPDQEAADTLLNRLVAQGIELEHLESASGDPAMRRARAAALEVAWEGAVTLAVREAARWRVVAAQVAAWKRPIVPAWTVAAIVIAAAFVVSGWLGGELASPSWFHPINALWWNLWP
ncbi:MAG TPA: hypothetical protein VGM20_00770 [Gemmatimonadales bacterium]|jgi:hypothetical protein